jgi:hypothetical protein
VQTHGFSHLHKTPEAFCAKASQGVLNLDGAAHFQYCVQRNRENFLYSIIRKKEMEAGNELLIRKDTLLQEFEQKTRRLSREA